MKQQDKTQKSYQFHGWAIVDEGASWCEYAPNGERLIDSVESSDVVENIIINVVGGSQQQKNVVYSKGKGQKCPLPCFCFLIFPESGICKIFPKISQPQALWDFSQFPGDIVYVWMYIQICQCMDVCTNMYTRATHQIHIM